MGQNSINSPYSSFYSINGNASFVRTNVSKQKNSNSQNAIPSVYLSQIQQEVPTKKKSNKKTWAAIIAGTLSALAITGWVLTRSNNGKWVKWLQDAAKRASEEAAKGEKATTFMGKMKYYADVTWAKTSRGLSTLTNFTPYKDRIFDKLFRNRFAKAIKADKIPDLFTKCSRAISMRRNTDLARGAINSADELTAYLSKLSSSDLSREIKIGTQTKTANAWIQEVQNLATAAKTKTGEVFGKTARDLRFTNVDSELEKSGFISKLENKLFGAKNEGSRLGQIRKAISEGYQTDILTKDLRAKATANLSLAYKPVEESAAKINKILNALYGDRATVHVAEVTKFTKALQKAAGSETGLYMRLSELKAGAALTDFGGLALAAAAGVYATATQDTQEQTIAAALTKGIPTIGGVGLCLFQTSLGLTGIVPLLVAILGGKIMSMIGAAVADKYIASNNEKKRFMDELMALRLAQSNVQTNPFFG